MVGLLGSTSTQYPHEQGALTRSNNMSHVLLGLHKSKIATALSCGLRTATMDRSFVAQENGWGGRRKRSPQLGHNQQGQSLRGINNVDHGLCVL